jgi:hypothetical protein
MLAIGWFPNFETYDRAMCGVGSPAPSRTTMPERRQVCPVIPTHSTSPKARLGVWFPVLGLYEMVFPFPSIVMAFAMI